MQCNTEQGQQLGCGHEMDCHLPPSNDGPHKGSSIRHGEQIPVSACSVPCQQANVQQQRQLRLDHLPAHLLSIPVKYLPLAADKCDEEDQEDRACCQVTSQSLCQGWVMEKNLTWTTHPLASCRCQRRSVCEMSMPVLAGRTMSPNVARPANTSGSVPFSCTIAKACSVYSRIL